MMYTAASPQVVSTLIHTHATFTYAAPSDVHLGFTSAGLRFGLTAPGEARRGVCARRAGAVLICMNKCKSVNGVHLLANQGKECARAVLELCSEV